MEEGGGNLWKSILTYSKISKIEIHTGLKQLEDDDSRALKF